MHTERLVQPAKEWMQERPTIAHEQLEDPAFSLRRAQDEITETLAEVAKVDTGISFEELRELILGEWTDVLNFIACVQFIFVQKYGFTEEEILARSQFTYGIRNHVKYPKENYQNGTPAKEQLQRDANDWFFAQAYLGSSWNRNPEYY